MHKNGGGGAYKHSSNNSGLRHYYATLNAEKQQDTHTNYKTEYKKQTTATQLVLWLLVFFMGCVFAMTPIFNFRKSVPIDAGSLGGSTFYINAPVFVAGDTNRSATLGSANSSTGELNTTAQNKPLFKTNGTVDKNVLNDLLNMLDDGKVKANATSNSGVTYYSAKNFGQYGTQTGWSTDKTGNAQILVKLFETAGADNINKLTSQYWQAVYRSVNDKSDVLTLYMTSSYLEKQQFDTSTQGNYSKSAIRNVITTDYTALSETFAQFDKYVVAPYQLSSNTANEMTNNKNASLDKSKCLNLGGWQSSAYQTSACGSTANNPPIKSQWLSEREKSIEKQLGSSGYCDAGDSRWGYHYSVNNGLDGIGDGWDDWKSIDSNYSDKLWIPSGFEALHTGYRPTTNAYLSKYDEDNDIVYLDDNYLKANAKINSSANTSVHSNSNRTGLWQLNGYDRGSNSWAWLRSGTSTFTHFARGINADGSNFDYRVGIEYAVRVALHLDLSALKSMSPETNLNLTATNNAVNSLLILTIMDGNECIAEYSCITGTISISVDLEQKKTYKILATRPFGSRLTVLLDGATLSPTNFACYEISTGTNNAMNLSFELTGDGSWKNCVVV